MKNFSWPILKPGDIVDIVAPGMKPRPQTLEGVVPFLESWGLEARLPKDLLGRDLLCANSRQKRFEVLKKAILSKDSKLIWCLRGGYGSFQLLPELNRLKPKNTKCFLGLSDVTSLHSFFVQQWRWSTIHGCNIDRFARGEGRAIEARRIKNLLFGQTPQLEYKLKALNIAAQKKSPILGQVIGGNLITLQANFGTAFQIQTKGQILFLEDIGERAYRVDRVLEQMSQLGLFKNLRAIVFGQFTGGAEPGGKISLVPKLLKQFALQQKFAVFSGLPSGHGKNQHPVPLGTKAKIDKATLIIDSGAQF